MINVEQHHFPSSSANPTSDAYLNHNAHRRQTTTAGQRRRRRATSKLKQQLHLHRISRRICPAMSFIFYEHRRLKGMHSFPIRNPYGVVAISLKNRVYISETSTTSNLIISLRFLIFINLGRERVVGVLWAPRTNRNLSQCTKNSIAGKIISRIFITVR